MATSDHSTMSSPASSSSSISPGVRTAAFLPRRLPRSMTTADQSSRPPRSCWWLRPTRRDTPTCHQRVMALDSSTCWMTAPWSFPTRPGNRRVDTFHNVLQNPHVALLFLVPGMSETLRVMGRASIVNDASQLERMAVNGKVPKLALAVDVDEAFVHCPKCIVRSDCGIRRPGRTEPRCPRLRRWCATTEPPVKRRADPTGIRRRAQQKRSLLTTNAAPNGAAHRQRRAKRARLIDDPVLSPRTSARPALLAAPLFRVADLLGQQIAVGRALHFAEHSHRNGISG